MNNKPVDDIVVDHACNNALLHDRGGKDDTGSVCFLNLTIPFRTGRNVVFKKQ